MSMEDRPRGWMFACPAGIASQINLDWADALRRVSHSLGAKRERPAVSEKEPPDAFGPATWEQILSYLPVPGTLRLVRSNTYGSARLLVLDDQSTDYLASWTPETADDWSPVMEAAAAKIVEGFAHHPTWKFTSGGAAGALLRLRGRALTARAGADGAVYYYWYEPL